ncbi:PQQ-binding-like beta-propeller repeat protein, partial [Salmonella enterica subsp. enterica serovar Minnesota]|uniref:outer membrane protein assembly factor BamB family protein n=1 Tax=Salmonella enterica TaxID=28901 RepID=UPI003D2A6555
FDEGPRAAPLVSGGRVYTYGAQAVLHCLDAATGKKIWSVDTQAPKGFFGTAPAPLLEGQALLVNVGRPDAGIVAYDK